MGPAIAVSSLIVLFHLVVQPPIGMGLTERLVLSVVATFIVVICFMTRGLENIRKD